MKKTFVLVVLFVLPIVAYLFFASGVNNFGRLPILTQGIDDVSKLDKNVTLKDKITILGFLGEDLAQRKGSTFNLNQKIYKRFYEFKDFQFVMVVPLGTEDQVEELRKELGHLVDIEKWRFVYSDKKSITNFFNGLGTDLELENDYGTPYVFIVDKDLNLRGRTDDEATKFGFNTNSVAELTNTMEDDVKIILAEYRLALKTNSAKRN